MNHVSINKTKKSGIYGIWHISGIAGMAAFLTSFLFEAVPMGISFLGGRKQQ